MFCIFEGAAFFLENQYFQGFSVQRLFFSPAILTTSKLRGELGFNLRNINFPWSIACLVERPQIELGYQSWWGLLGEPMIWVPIGPLL